MHARMDACKSSLTAFSRALLALKLTTCNSWSVCISLMALHNMAELRRLYLKRMVQDART